MEMVRALRQKPIGGNKPELLEDLESRVLLSGAPSGPINLMPSGVSQLKIPADIVTGKVLKGTFKATVAETEGNSTGSQKIEVVAALRPTGGGSDVSITPKAGTVSNIQGHKSKPATLNFTIPANLAAGHYSLVVTIDPNGTVTETNEADNNLVLADIVVAADPFVVLAGGLNNLAKFPTTVVAGGNAKISFQPAVTNNGNVQSAPGPANLTIVIHPSTGPDISVVNKTIQLPAIKNTRSINLENFTIPVTAQVPAGDYTVVATVTPADASVAAFTITSPTVTVTSAANPGGGIFKNGDTITFKATNIVSLIIETGTFVTSTNATGTYTSGAGFLQLSYDGGGSDGFIESLPGARQFLDTDPTDNTGVTVMFDQSSANSFVTLTTASGKAYGHLV